MYNIFFVPKSSVDTKPFYYNVFFAGWGMISAAACSLYAPLCRSRSYSGISPGEFLQLIWVNGDLTLYLITTIIHSMTEKIKMVIERIEEILICQNHLVNRKEK